MKKKNKTKNNMVKYIFFGLCFLLIGSIFFLYFGKNNATNNSKNNQKLAVSYHNNKNRLIFKMPNPKEVIFDSFLIPFEKSKESQIISLMISIKVPNIKIRERIFKKRRFFRAIIYEGIRNEINKRGTAFSMEEIESRLSKKINEEISESRMLSLHIKNVKII